MKFSEMDLGYRVTLAVLGFLAAALFGAGIAVGIVHPQSFSNPPEPSLPACSQEDSANCYWDARIHGNGTGRSFVDLKGHTFYLEEGR